MKQFLRSFLTLLMLVVWASGFAQGTETIDLTKQGFKNKDEVSVVMGTDVKLNFAKGKSSSNPPKYYTNKDGNAVRLYKNGTLKISSTSKKIEKIVFTIVKGKGDLIQTFFSDGTYTPNSFTWKGSTNDLTITVGNVVWFQKLEITYTASNKTHTTLKFPKPTINIEEGNEANFTGQTATLKTGETELDNAITYTTNNDAMFEEYDAKVGPTTLKTGKYGTATVTAKFNGDDTYEASTATYTVNYTEKEKPATTLDFGFATKTANVNETFTATATLKAGETAISGAVTYTSSNHKVATVNETTGEVSALTAGITKITATFAGTSEYKSSTASYDLTVVDPNAAEVTFDFSKPKDYGYEAPGSGSATNLEEGEKIQSGVITITNIKSGKSGSNTNKARFHNKGGNITFRVYANGEITLSAQPGYTITKFVFASSQGGSLTVSPGTYDSKTKTWEGNAQTITLTIPNGQQATFFQTMTVNYSKSAANPTLTLDENAEDTNTKIKANDGKTVDVTLTRSLKAGVWNTICLPFNVTAEQVESVLKATGNVKEFDKEDKATATIFFKPATEMKAGVPYLIKPTEDATVLNFKDVTINNVDELSRINGNDYCICGVFGKYTMNTNGTELFLNAAGKFVAPAAATNTMKGFRAYFYVPSKVSAAALNINIDGETTGINNIETEATVNGKVYNLNGQYVGNSLNGLKKGIYVVNGKKVIK